MEDRLMTVKEVSKELQINVNKVYDLINHGLLPGIKLGSMKVRQKSLLAFLEKFDGMDLSDLSQIKSVNG